MLIAADRAIHGPKGQLTHITPRKRRKKNKKKKKRAVSAPEVLTVKPLSASICYRPELCINRNSSYEEAYPSWGMSFTASTLQWVEMPGSDGGENCQDWMTAFVCWWNAACEEILRSLALKFVGARVSWLLPLTFLLMYKHATLPNKYFFFFFYLRILRGKCRLLQVLLILISSSNRDMEPKQKRP